MQSTGQASTQAVSFVPMQGSAITYAIDVVFPNTYTYHSHPRNTIRELPSAPAAHQTVEDAGQSSKSCFPRRGAGHAISPCNQGAAQGDAAHRRQADHSIRGRGSAA